MEVSPVTRGSVKRKSLRVGILDLEERQPSRSFYGRMLNANFACIMPQVVAVWAEQMGHQVHFVTYTGFEDLHRELPQDIDILFIHFFTQAAYLAYSISNLYRRRNVVTVLGGPHARAYPEDAADYFDYVVGLTDRELISDLLRDFSPNPKGGVMLSAKRQPVTLPGVRERWKYIQQNLDKTRILHIVQMLGSLGCPYKCNFCIDAEMDYQTMPYDELREDLAFLQSQPSPPAVGWIDPNFGVRFDDYLNLIESVVKPGKLAFIAETSLSLLSEPHLKRLKANRFVMLSPGIESWFDYNDKAKQRKHVGMEKVRAVAEHVNLIMRYIPYVQTNFIFGWDSDAGAEPFELTKSFLDLAPGVYPKYSLLTAFGRSAPLTRQFQDEGRMLDVPFYFLDGYSGLNIKMKNYSHQQLFEHFIGLTQYTVSTSMIWRRFKANKYPLGRWVNLVRALTTEKVGRGGMIRHYQSTCNSLATDPEFREFYSGESIRPPSVYLEQITRSLSSFSEHLPEKVFRYLKVGEPAPNPRISNMLSQPVEASGAPAIVKIARA